MLPVGYSVFPSSASSISSTCSQNQATVSSTSQGSKIDSEPSRVDNGGQEVGAACLIPERHDLSKLFSDIVPDVQELFEAEQLNFPNLACVPFTPTQNAHVSVVHNVATSFISTEENLQSSSQITQVGHGGLCHVNPSSIDSALSRADNTGTETRAHPTTEWPDFDELLSAFDFPECSEAEQSNFPNLACAPLTPTQGAHVSAVHNVAASFISTEENLQSSSQIPQADHGGLCHVNPSSGRSDPPSEIGKQPKRKSRKEMTPDELAAVRAQDKRYDRSPARKKQRQAYRSRPDAGPSDEKDLTV